MSSVEKETLEYVVGLADPVIKVINGESYADRELIHIDVVNPPNPFAQKINVKTLSSIVDLIKNEMNGFDLPLIVKVCDYKTVVVMSAMDKFDKSRETCFVADAELPHLTFDNFFDVSQMIIMLKSKFVQTTPVLDFVKLIGNIKEENVKETGDSGISQSVVVKKGIAMSENVTAPSIISLKPFRTFLEVEQPESEFFVRLKDGPEVALFEADGGAWKLEAMRNIQQYLVDALCDLHPNVYIIA